MDEQMMQQSAQAETESYTPETTEATDVQEVSEFGDYDAPPMLNGKPSEVALDEDGNVKFSEGFFEDKPESKPEVEQPRYYTHEELQSTPFEQWQKNRVPEELREYYDIVSNQLQRRYAQRQIETRPSAPPFMEQPRAYTPKELSEEAQRIAVQRLGLEDADDFDDYEPEHRAALNMAMNELVQENQQARQKYERATQEYRNLQQFNAQLVSRPDYKEFETWFDRRLKELKVSPQVIDEYLTNYARQSGGNYGAIQNVVSGWYNEFLQSKVAQRATRPPMMESPGGQGYETLRGVNMREFGDMSPDAQAAALMRMGYV